MSIPCVLHYSRIWISFPVYSLSPEGTEVEERLRTTIPLGNSSGHAKQKNVYKWEGVFLKSRGWWTDPGWTYVLDPSSVPLLDLPLTRSFDLVFDGLEAPHPLGRY